MNNPLDFLWALLFLPFIWLECLTAPFTDFTFTAASDFIFAVLMIATLVVVTYRHVKKPYSARWIKFASTAALLLAVLTPLVLLITLYFFSWRAETLIGHWPRWMADDPKYIGTGDVLYQRFGGAMDYAEAFAGWALFTWAAMMLHLRRSLSPKQWARQAGIFIVAWVAFIWEPGARYWWWLDIL